jgi:hypothetical protein
MVYTIAYISQLPTYRNCLHIAIAYISQLPTYHNCLHIAIAYISQSEWCIQLPTYRNLSHLKAQRTLLSCSQDFPLQMMCIVRTCRLLTSTRGAPCQLSPMLEHALASTGEEDL